MNENGIDHFNENVISRFVPHIDNNINNIRTFFRSFDDDRKIAYESGNQYYVDDALLFAKQ